MYAEHGLIFPLLQSFPHHLPAQLDDDQLSRFYAQIHCDAHHMRNLQEPTSSILEYDLEGEGDLFKAPEPIIEEPVLTLDPFSAAMTIISNGQDVITETMKVADMESIQNEHFNDVLYECTKELLERYGIDEAFPEINDVKTPVAETAEVSSLGNIRLGGGEGQLQKSVSSGCLNSVEWINGCNVRPNFLDFQGMDFETAFGMRRAYSEGDIQALGNNNANFGNASTVRASFERQLTISELKTEDRKQKLSRYRKKKTKRNFGRKIKYACRKALADSQPRVRGRFAKSEEREVSEPHK